MTAAAAAAYVDPLDRPKLTLGEVVKLQEELANERIKPARRDEILMRLKLAHEREGVAFDGREPHNGPVFGLITEVIKEDYVRRAAVVQREVDARQAAKREERRLLVEGRPGRFSALPGPMQVAMYAESQATDARAGWKAYREALALQAAGKPIPVPWLFETELLDAAEMWQLARRGLVDSELAEEAERRGVRESSPW
jgi:hypothetical protein